jgi:hypothetical protein
MRLCDLPVLVDHVCDAAGVLVGRFLCRAVREADLLVRVAEEGEGKTELLRKGSVFILRVEADAEDDGVLCFVLADEVPEPGTLERSAGCVGLRVEPEHDLLAAQVAEANRVAVVIDRFEIGSLISWIQHVRLFSNR